MTFPPVAIIGQGCVLPGASSPNELWKIVQDGRSVLDHAPAGLWGVYPGADLDALTRETLHDIGGYVTVGYQNEHHDLPSVPWNHLPDIRRGAPEMYNSLAHHTSWTSLLLKCVFDPSLCLFSRTVRTDRGRVALNAEVKPDIEFPDAC